MTSGPGCASRWWARRPSTRLSKPWKAWPAEMLKLLDKKPVTDNDGLMKIEWTRFGKKFLLLQKPHDHANMIEDPSVVDEMARALL